MIQGREPNIKPGKFALKEYYCKSCGIIIIDPHSAPIDPKIIQGIKLSSQKDVHLCKACAGEECQQNYKHPVELLPNGLHFCKYCNRVIERTGGYKEHMKENEIKVEAKIIPV